MQVSELGFMGKQAKPRNFQRGFTLIQWEFLGFSGLFYNPRGAGLPHGLSPVGLPVAWLLQGPDRGRGFCGTLLCLLSLETILLGERHSLLESRDSVAKW